MKLSLTQIVYVRKYCTRGRRSYLGVGSVGSLKHYSFFPLSLSFCLAQVWLRQHTVIHKGLVTSMIKVVKGNKSYNTINHNRTNLLKSLCLFFPASLQLFVCLSSAEKKKGYAPSPKMANVWSSQCQSTCRNSYWIRYLHAMMEKTKSR